MDVVVFEINSLLVTDTYMPGDLSQWTGTWLDCTRVLVSSQSSGAQVDSRSNISSESWAMLGQTGTGIVVFLIWLSPHTVEGGGWRQPTHCKIP